MHGVQSVTDLMVRPGIINLDFADVETVMASMGKAMMGTGEAEGDDRAMKAAEMAISNPLIDDYTLKGAKGLLVNITGGEDLKLFEVDEVVNKIRSEVDVEAEVIIGAITDPSLDGKIRVSIVATALDGQKPEAKSVINMVHRIQNRNPGYSDFTNTGSASSFNFSQTMSNSSPITHGANALKLENEVVTEHETNTNSSQMMNEQIMSTRETEVENIVENNEMVDYEQSFSEEALNTVNETEVNNLAEKEHDSNGLENFGVEENSPPDLFSSDSDSDEPQNLLSTENNEENSEDDDLEIPAFLRRQKN
jgi:cell division protein FtsZ